MFIGITLRVRIIQSVPLSVPRRRFARNFLCAVSNLRPLVSSFHKGLFLIDATVFFLVGAGGFVCAKGSSRSVKHR